VNHSRPTTIRSKASFPSSEHRPALKITAPRVALAWSVATLAAAALQGCTNSAKVSEEKAVAHAERLAKLADTDVDELRRGLPRGAKALSSVWDDSRLPSHGELRRTLERVRGEDIDLSIAKGTFFALTDGTGTVVASDQDPDRPAGRSMQPAFSALAKALAGEPVETRGEMPELAGAKSGTDEEWLAAVPVVDGSGAVRGLYVSGWSMRRFAYHLEETLKHDLVQQAGNSGPVKLPLVYAFVFAGGKVYGAPVTPLVNGEALQALDLAGKTGNGATFHQQLEITGRSYGFAARRCPNMGADVGVAVLRSET
jgi:hypothetical protein